MIALWDVASGNLRLTFFGHAHGVDSVAFSPDGRALASGGDDYTIKLWNAGSGSSLRTLTGHTSLVFPSLSALMAAPWPWEAPMRRSSCGRGQRGSAAHPHRPRGLCLLRRSQPDGRTLASGSEDKTIRLWDVASGKKLPTLTGHTGGVASVAFSPDSRTLASGSWDKTIKPWNVASGSVLRTLTGDLDTVGPVAFSPDGRTLATGSGDETIRLWDVASGRTLHTLTPGPSGGVFSVAFSPDGRIWLGERGWHDQAGDVASGARCAPSPFPPSRSSLPTRGRQTLFQCFGMEADVLSLADFFRSSFDPASQCLPAARSSPGKFETGNFGVGYFLFLV